eukprot:jgi/Mesvir1/177/Mv13532-RA.3
MPNLPEDARDIRLAFDGNKSLYTAKELPRMPPEGVVLQVTVHEDAGGASSRGGGASSSRDRDRDRDRDGGGGGAPASSGSRRRGPPMYDVHLRSARLVELANIADFIQGRVRVPPQDVVQALDVVLSQHGYDQFVGFKSKFYHPSFGRSDAGLGCESWRGFYQSVRLTQAGVVVNMDMVATAMIAPLPIVDYIAQALGKQGTRDLARGLSDFERNKIKRLLKNLKVETLYGSKRGYKVSGMARETPAQAMFDGDNGARISVARYFEDKYGCRLQFPNLPCVQVGPVKRGILVPAELLKIRNGQRYLGRMTPGMVTSLLKAACIRPNDRFRELEDTLARCDLNNDPFMKAFSLGVDPKPLDVKARLLEPPSLFYGDGPLNAQAGQWNMTGRRVFEGATINAWMALNLDCSLAEGTFHSFLETLAHKCVGIGMRMGPPIARPLMGQITHAEERLREAVAAAREAIVRKSEGNPLSWMQLRPELLVVVLKDKCNEYNMIKRVCETELGVITQCVLSKHVHKHGNQLDQYLANVALKINVKAGGRNNALLPKGPVPSRLPPHMASGPGLLAQEPTIIFGADVVHPTGFEAGWPSVASVVASMDWPHATKYRASMRSQIGRKEIIENLFTTRQQPDGALVGDGLILEQLKQFYASTGGLKPSRIIFYRDGVSEGQFKAVLLHELTAIRQACCAIEPEYCPRITFIVVQKKHNTRFCPVNPADTCAGPSGNVKPGLVVDTDVCHPTDHDFYLTSHVGLQGTAKPTHYNVLWDENKFSADDIQELTNGLCYTFARCTRSVSVVPAVYYAHLAAFRARLYLEKEESYSDTESRASQADAPMVGGHRLVPLPPLVPFVQTRMFYC